MLAAILLTLLILWLIGAWSAWPLRRGRGLYLGTGIGMLVVVILVLLLAGPAELVDHRFEFSSDLAIQRPIRVEPWPQG